MNDNETVYFFKNRKLIFLCIFQDANPNSWWYFLFSWVILVTIALGSLFVPSPNSQISFWSPIPWPDWKSVHSLSCVLIPVFFDSDHILWINNCWLRCFIFTSFCWSHSMISFYIATLPHALEAEYICLWLSSWGFYILTISCVIQFSAYACNFMAQWSRKKDNGEISNSQLIQNSHFHLH